MEMNIYVMEQRLQEQQLDIASKARQAWQWLAQDQTNKSEPNVRLHRGTAAKTSHTASCCLGVAVCC